MRSNRWAGIVAAGVLLLGLLFFWGPMSPGQAPAARVGAIWEYKTAFLPAGGDPQESLNKLGTQLGPQGWGLVTIVERGGEWMCVFKRVKQ
jgi:hypothetical protein